MDVDLRGLVRGALAAVLSMATLACVARATPPVNPGYGYGLSTQGHASANVAVGQPAPYYVSSSPPEPLYEQMSDSPGDGSVWIDGYWHWNGYEWLWINGRWEREQVGYVYVEPSYDWVDTQAQYVYTPGYWAEPTRVPHGWHLRDHRDGRPTRVAPPYRPAAPPGGYRPPVVYRPPSHGGGGGPAYYPRPRPRPYPTGGTVYYPPEPAPSPEPAPAPPAPVPAGQPAPPLPGGGVVYRPAPAPAPSPAPYHPPSRDLPWHTPTRVDNGPSVPAPAPAPAPAQAPAAAPAAPAPVYHAPHAPPPTPGRAGDRPPPSRREP
ncbi:MAG TPA: hypothetical protein VGC42_22655 [Kofleriaceae bacterium]